MVFTIDDGWEVFATGKRYLVKGLARAEKVGTIWLPETTKERLQMMSEVVERGTDEGPYCAEIGDRILHSPHAGVPLMVGELEYRSIDEKDVLAVVKKAPHVGKEIKNRKTLYQASAERAL